MPEPTYPALTSLAKGGGCGCKLAPDVLSNLLGAAPDLSGFPDLLVGAATSDDAAVYRVSDDTALVATTDFFNPIVDDPYVFGQIAATNALSDIYAMGARPIFSLALLGMPIDTLPPDIIKAIIAGGQDTALKAGAPVAGGHSIDTSEPLYGLVALGTAHPDRLLTNAGAQAGDTLILGKPLGIGVFSAAYKRGLLSDADYQQMVASTTRLNTPGLALAGVSGVHALTDVTGFGLAGHCGELCKAASLDAYIDFARTPIFDGALALAETGIKTGASGRNRTSLGTRLSFSDRGGAKSADHIADLMCDPQTSGGLLVACADAAVDRVLACFQSEGHAEAAVIGTLKAGTGQIHIRA